MLIQDGEMRGCFDIKAPFQYDKEQSNLLYYDLLADQKKIESWAKNNGKLEEYNKAMNLFAEMAAKYDPLANNESGKGLTSKYANAYNELYTYVPHTNLWGEEKPFDFLTEFSRYSKVFGIPRNLAKTEITTPYFVPTPCEDINRMMSHLAYNLAEGWNDDNNLVKLAKMEVCLTAIQPLTDGNHRASHAFIQYYLGRSGLPSINRNKHLKEHYESFLIFEKEAILNSKIGNLIMYYYYNIRERQEDICKKIGAPVHNLIGQPIAVEDEIINIDEGNVATTGI